MTQLDMLKIMELSPVPFCLVQKGSIMHANNQMGQLSGYSKEELVNITLDKLIFPADCHLIQSRIYKALPLKVDDTPLELRMISCRGHVFPVLGFFSPFIFKGRPAVICQFIDSDCLEGIKILRDGEKAQAEELRLREVIDQFSSAVAIYEAVEKGNDFIVKDFNLAAERIDKIERQDILGQSVLEVFSGIKKWGLFDVFVRVWRTGAAEHFPAYIYQDARTVGWRESYIFKLQTGEIVSVYNDITQWKQAETELKDSEKRFREIFSQSPIGIALYDMRGRLIDANKAYLDLFGLADVQLVKGRELLGYRCDPHFLQDNLVNGEPVKYTEEVNFDELKRQGLFPTEKTGSCYFDYLISPLKTERDHCYGFLMQVQDITARKLAEAKLEYLSLHDSLTGSYNRAYFDQEVRRLEESRGASLGIIMFDIDDLKLINDTLGHPIGDTLLVAGADIIKNCFRAGDMVARIGGDEFVVLLPNCDLDAVVIGCQRVKEAVLRHNKKNLQLPLSISMGYAFGQGTKQSAKLLKEADDHLYREKIQRKQDVHQAIIGTIMDSLKEKDFFAHGHAVNLERLGADFAQILGLDQTTAHYLSLLTQFHDIGKVGISDLIIFKADSLTPDEQGELERHCEIGHRIALSAPGLAAIADLILKHHEWWNGEGYPLGLKEESIPIECRIFRILDAFETMTHDRPRHRAMSSQDALRKLVKESGSQFDPFLVNKFVDFLSI